MKTYEEHALLLAAQAETLQRALSFRDSVVASGAKKTIGYACDNLAEQRLDMDRLVEQFKVDRALMKDREKAERLASSAPPPDPEPVQSIAQQAGRMWAEGLSQFRVLRVDGVGQRGHEITGVWIDELAEIKLAGPPASEWKPFTCGPIIESVQVRHAPCVEHAGEAVIPAGSLKEPERFTVSNKLPEE